MFTDIVVRSAGLYYKYLTDKNYGLAVSKVLRIEKSGNDYKLYLDSSIRMFESVQIRINGYIYTQRQVSPRKFDNKNKILYVSLSYEAGDVFVEYKNKTIEVISDLKFLVKRLEEWYKKYGLSLSLKRTNFYPSYYEPDDKSYLSDEQKKAVETILSQPFSYVWGAPGTGKTRYVLSECILNYVTTGKKVLITAPTNNALEQILYGLLPVMADAGINISEHVLRLGVSSSEFFDIYPDICESKETGKTLSIISDSVLSLKNSLADIEKQINMYPDYVEFNKFMSKWEHCKNILPNLFLSLKDVYERIEDLKSTLTLCNAKLVNKENELKSNRAKSANLIKQIDRTVVLINKYKSGLKSVIFSKRLKRYNVLLEQLTRDFEVLEDTRKSIEDGIDEINEIVKNTKNLINIESAKSYELHIDIRNATEFWKELSIEISSVEYKDFDKIDSVLNKFLERYRDRISTSYEKYKSITCSIEELLLEKTAVELELNELLLKSEKAVQSEEKNIYKRTVIAVTIDTMLNRILPDGDFIPEHIFLDEAGYCSLIKAATLTAFDCPITFLGDHMQLPPVCEMNDDLFEVSDNMPVFLWAQSALYIEELFTKPISEVFEAYRKRENAKFDLIKKCDLTHTYRFSQSLASILASRVYSERFKGDDNYSTHLYYIHAPKYKDSTGRGNNSECEAILRFLNNKNISNVGIITPYKDQRDILRKNIPEILVSAEDIITVHASQGREWDTIILSVSDTTNMWFTNSLLPKSNGLKLINTAVSRAKKNLIIVCDTDYWFEQKRQLIGNILSSCQPIEDFKQE